MHWRGLARGRGSALARAGARWTAVQRTSLHEHEGLRDRAAALAWAPGGAGVALLALALAGHSVVPWLAPLAAGALAWGVRGVHRALPDAASRASAHAYTCARALVRPVGWTGAIWLGLGWGWLALPGGWPVLGAWVALVGGWYGAWWWYGVLLERPEAVPVPEAPSLMTGWDEIVASAGLPGVGAVLVRRDEVVVHLRLSLTAQWTVAEVVRRLSRLEVAIARFLAPGVQLRRGACRLEADPANAHLAHLHVMLRDPLAAARACPGQIGERWGDPIRIGFFGPAEDVVLTVNEEHILVAGVSGSGKSVLLTGVALALMRPDTIVVAMDPSKEGADLGLLGPRLERLETTPLGMARLVDALLQTRQARALWMAAEGLTQWPNSPERPHILVVVDELRKVLETAPSTRHGLRDLVNLGRQQGFTILLGGQRVLVEDLGDSLALRSGCKIRIGLAADEPTDAEAIFGDRLAGEGYSPDRLLRERGSFLVYAPGQHETPRPARGWNWTAETIAERVRDLASTRPAPNPAHDGALTALASPASPAPRPTPATRAELAEGVVRDMLAEVGERGVHIDALLEAVGALPHGERRERRWVYDRLNSSAEPVPDRRGWWRERGAGPS